MDYASFEPLLGGWAEKLRPFIESPECDEIYAYLKKRSMEGKIICPPSSYTWRAFEETPYQELKVIMFMQDPYPWKKGSVYVADGVALSCKQTGILQPSLELFYDGIQREMPEYKGYYRDPDLSYLCNQGIMMLNSSLTVELGRPGSHSSLRVEDKKVRLWEPFMRWFISEIIESRMQGLVLVFSGKESAYYERFVYPHRHYILKCEHPASAAHQEREWDTGGIFTFINKVLWENNKVTVDWMNSSKKNTYGKARSRSNGD